MVAKPRRLPKELQVKKTVMLDKRVDACVRRLRTALIKADVGADDYSDVLNTVLVAAICMARYCTFGDERQARDAAFRYAKFGEWPDEGVTLGEPIGSPAEFVEALGWPAH